MTASTRKRPDGPWHNKEWLIEALMRHGNAARIADAEGVTRNTIRMAMQKHRIDATSMGEAHPPLIPREDTPFTAQGDIGLISDLHVPMVRYDVLDHFIDECKDAGITQVGIIGDFLNCDALANHERKQHTAGLPVEREHAKAAMARLLEAFDSVLVARGNHDRHPQRALGGSVTFDHALRMLLEGVDAKLLERMRVSNKDAIRIATGEGEWLAAHTYSYSRIAMAYPMKLAVRHGVHVAAAHRHHHGVCRAPNGKYAVELGGAFDVSRMQYVHEWTNDLPEMVNGFCLLIDGRPRLPMLTA